MTTLSAPNTEVRKAVIAVCTFRRVPLLRPLVHELMEQIAKLPEYWRARVVVIDNDPKGSALQELSRIARDYDDKCFSYVHESRAGVGYARNLAFTLAGVAEWLIFFDDDQLPDESWLSQLLSAGSSGRGELYVGPVRPSLPKDCPAWARGGWAWARPEFSDGEYRSHAGFGNILISPVALSDPSCKVKAAFIQGPGEDTSVTSELVAKGYRIVHVSGASAAEPVPVQRLNMPWVLARQRAAGKVWAQLQLSGRKPAARLCLSFLRLLVNAASLGLRGLALRSSRDCAKARAKVAIARGYVDAVVSSFPLRRAKQSPETS